MDELDTLLVRVRADTGAFARDVADMKGQLDGPLAGGVDAAGRVIENTLSRAIRTGKLGFDDLRKVALSVLADISSQSIRTNIGALFGGGGSGGAGGLIGSLASAASSLFGLPGRATGGPVTGGRAYMVGERGPELFVPTSSGRIETARGGRGPVSVTVNVAAPANASPQFMARSGAQVARAVRDAIAKAG